MSPIVEAWATCRTSNALNWPPGRLLQAKGHATVSVVIPARNEAATVGTIVRAIRAALVQSVPLVDEIIVVDSRSVDETAAEARAAGAFVVSQDDVTGGLPPMHGKGGATWAVLQYLLGLRRLGWHVTGTDQDEAVFHAVDSSLEFEAAGRRPH